MNTFLDGEGDEGEGPRPLFSVISVIDGPIGAVHRAAWSDPARAGPRLMAADEALLHEIRSPALRLYEWEDPWLSIGYFEEAPAQADLPMVRRWTGGGIVHHRPATELTYALSVPRGHPFYAISPVESYRRIHGAVCAALNGGGIASVLYAGDPAPSGGACFQKPMPGDILARGSGAKVAGAGQRRHRLGLLHQGSIQLEEKVPAGLGDRLVASLAGRAERDPALDAAVLARSETLLVERYGTDLWLHRTSGRRH